MPEQITETQTVQVQPPIVSDTTKNKKSSRVILLVILGMLVLAGAVYAGMNLGKKQSPPEVIPQATQPTLTPDPTADWKTYTSNDLGISFQHPSSWVISPNVSKEFVTFYPRGYVPKDHDDSSVFSCSPYGMGREIDLASLKQLPISNLDSILYYGDSFGTIIVKPNLICVLDATSKIGEFDLYKDDFIKILSTFKFVENNSKEVLETMGTITGKLCYPSDFLPPGEIAAKNVLTKEVFKQKYPGSMADGKNTYSFELTPGNYFVRYEAHASLSKPDIFTSGYYTFCSINLEQCATDQNHETLEVEVKIGETKSGIDICDFYYGPDNEPEF